MLTRKQKLALASASIGTGLIFSLNSNLLPLILIQHTSSAFFIGIVIGIAQFLGVLIPPIIGTVSDNTWTRFGRRKPYIIIFMPLTVLVMFAVFLVGQSAVFQFSFLSSFVLLAAFIFLLFTFFNVWNSPYTALLPDLTEPAERGETSGYLQAFNILGTIFAFMIGAAIWEQYPLVTFLIFAAVIAVSAIITIITVHEKKAIATQEKASMASILKDFVKEKEFMKLMFTSTTWWFGIGTLLSFFVLFAKESLHLPESSALIFMGLFTIVLVAFAVPSGIIADKFGKKRILSLGVMLGAIGLLIGAFSSNIIVLYCAMGITALGFGAILVLNFALTADLLPKGKEGKFMGLGNIFSAAPQAAAAPIMGFIISAFNNDYRMIFYIAPMALALGLICLQFVEIKT
jgi:Na+/melibiose symporter-like transporter